MTVGVGYRRANGDASRQVFKGTHVDLRVRSLLREPPEKSGRPPLKIMTLSGARTGPCRLMSVATCWKNGMKSVSASRAGYWA